MSANMQKKVMKTCRTKLVDEIDEVLPLLESVYRSGCLTATEFESISSRSSRTDQAQLLLDILEHKGSSGYAALREALHDNYPKLTETLDTEMAKSVSMKYGLHTEEGMTTSTAILCAAIEKGYYGAVRDLVVDAKVDLMHRWNGLTPLETACKFNREQSLRLLYNKGGILSLTALHTAVTYGSAECSTLVLTLMDEARLRIDQQDEHGMTALHYACREGHADIVRQLLLRGADPLLRPHNGRVAIQLAVCHRDATCLKTLLDYADVDVNVKGGTDGNTALHDACVYGADGDIIKLLIDHGANVDIQNNQQWTPLHSAIRSKQWNSCLESLVKFGKPKLTIPDDSGITVSKMIQTMPEDKKKIFSSLIVHEKQIEMKDGNVNNDKEEIANKSVKIKEE